MDRLRSPGGCPWDAEQTHASLAPYLVEETYEALDAIESGDPDALREELGDVLLQVLFHARIAAERPVSDGGFDVDDVARGLVDKLTRRHPHVFGDVAVSGADEVIANWEQLKQAEKQRSSVTEGIGAGQPALAWAAALRRRAGRTPVTAAVAAPSPAPGDPAAAIGAELLDVVGVLLHTASIRSRRCGHGPRLPRGPARGGSRKPPVVEPHVTKGFAGPARRGGAWRP